MVNKIPSRIKIDQSMEKLCSELRDLLPGKPYNSDIFALALAYGYNSGNRIPLQSKRDFINRVSISDELNSLILFIGLIELGDLAIENPAKMYALAEEYANGGFKELYVDVNKNNQFNMKMYQDLIDATENELF